MSRRKAGPSIFFQWPYWMFWAICSYILQTQIGLGTLPAIVIGFPAAFVLITVLAILLKGTVFVFGYISGRARLPEQHSAEPTEKPKRIFVGMTIDENGVERTEIKTNIEVREDKKRKETVSGDVIDSSVREFLKNYPDD